MHPRLDDDGAWQFELRDESPRAPGAARLQPERMQQLRERIAVDAYCSVGVVDEIARRILRSRDL